MSKHLQIIALFCIGIAAGFFAAYYSFDCRETMASGGADRSGEYIITSGLLDGGAGATYFLDCSTGTLTATVPACRGQGGAAGIWGMYKADVTKALRAFITQNPKDAFGQPLEMPSKPSYVMTTAPFHYLGKLGSISWPAECISIVETQTGIQFLFVVPFNATKYKQGTLEMQGEMRCFTAKQINPVMKRRQL